MGSPERKQKRNWRQLYCSSAPPEDDDEEYKDPFETPEERRIFVARVFGIVSAMLAVDISFVAMCYYFEPLHLIVKDNILLYIISYALFLITYLLLLCVPAIRDRSPINIIMLVILTVSMGCLLSVITARHNLDNMIFALLVTLLITVVAFLFCRFVPIDITSWGPYLFFIGIALLVLAVGSIVVCLLGFCGTYARLISLTLTVFFIFLYTVYLVMDIQLILGDRQIKIQKDEYVRAVLLLFTDVINIFLCLLNLSKDLFED